MKQARGGRKVLPRQLDNWSRGQLLCEKRQEKRIFASTSIFSPPQLLHTLYCELKPLDNCVEYANSAFSMASKNFTFVVEHLDPELGPWSALEYKTIADESRKAGCDFILSSVPASLIASEDFTHVKENARSDSIENYFADKKSQICLLDPAATQELVPEDAAKFDIFLFGGILGDDPPRDRTSELRKKGFEGRRLGPKQMTTDTAVRVTRIVIQEQSA
jgi:ribosome biogenesis SPOUT family RNA methylase Rps3